MRKFLVLLGATLFVSAMGCDAPVPTGETASASSVLPMLGNDFTDNYVKIRGARAIPADRKYPCLSEFEMCLGLDKAGVTDTVWDLCPSDNTPEGTWSFSYVVFADKDCKVPLANLGCVPTRGEWLHPGSNHNDVVCITRNADKNFDLCVMDPVTGAGSEFCPPCIPNPGAVSSTPDACNPGP